MSYYLIFIITNLRVTFLPSYLLIITNLLTKKDLKLLKQVRCEWGNAMVSVAVRRYGISLTLNTYVVSHITGVGVNLGPTEVYRNL